MATSSITHNFVISGEERVQRFIDALDEADKDREPKRSPVSRQLRDSREIEELMARWRENNAKQI